MTKTRIDDVIEEMLYQARNGEYAGSDALYYAAYWAIIAYHDISGILPPGTTCSTSGAPS